MNQLAGKSRTDVLAWRQNRVLMLGIGAGALLLATVITLRSLSPVVSAGYWYYNLDSGELVVVDVADSGSPTTLASGARGVRARVFACGGCDSETFVGYLEMENARPPIASSDQPMNLNHGFLVAAPPEHGSEARWFLASSSEGAHILSRPRERCGASVQECVP